MSTNGMAVVQFRAAQMVSRVKTDATAAEFSAQVFLFALETLEFVFLLGITFDGWEALQLIEQAV